MSQWPATRAGSVRVASEVVGSIAALAALDVEGVAAMCAPQGPRVGRLLRRQHGHLGVRVTTLDHSSLRLDLHLAIVPTVRLPELVERVQAAVADSVNRMLGLRVAAVDVHVADVQLP